MVFKNQGNWLAILLDDGGLHLTNFDDFPATYEWGRTGETPSKYILHGKTYRQKSMAIKIRYEGKPTDPDVVLDDTELGKIITVIDADHSKSESLRAQREDKDHLPFIMGVVMGAAIGVVFGLVLSHFMG